ncbi:orotate phosphoribosyltransferase [bacterium]|nr:orotate phosphoribosyltransferase [bacterium]NIN92832.1 orotate phosphoribosyltransferase [bacterium]NIO18787.1 orotate phosphoribosyltransferase [bacterium]NIO73868.1 orotate phosphoribosyltransferase [bacterium]
MTEREVLEIFEKSGALLSGHFRLSSGLHSEKYLQCALVLQYPDLAQKLCNQLASVLELHGSKIDAVVSPAIGGIVVGQEVAKVLGCRAIFCEREQGKMKLRRGFKIEKEEKVIIVEDVITTGGSVKDIVKIVQDLGGKVEGIGVIVDRSKPSLSDELANLNLSLKSLLRIDIETYSPQECPICKKAIPLQKPGSR